MTERVERKASDTSRSRERVGGIGHALGDFPIAKECSHVKTDAQATPAGREEDGAGFNYSEGITVDSPATLYSLRVNVIGEDDSDDDENDGGIEEDWEVDKFVDEEFDGPI